MATFIPDDRRRHTRLGDCQEELDQLRDALASRPVIDQAKGVLVAQTGCTPEEAFERLRQASQRENRKLRDVARRVVESAQSTPEPPC